MANTTFQAQPGSLTGTSQHVSARLLGLTFAALVAGLVSVMHAPGHLRPGLGNA